MERRGLNMYPARHRGTGTFPHVCVPTLVDSRGETSRRYDVSRMSAHRRTVTQASGNMAQEGASTFTKNKSIKEQRRCLPVYAVREQLLTVIRDNQAPYSSSNSYKGIYIYGSSDQRRAAWDAAIERARTFQSGLTVWLLRTHSLDSDSKSWTLKTRHLSRYE